MSSEMREVDQLGFALQRLLTPKQWEQEAITDRLNAIRSLLARTEAGADGAVGVLTVRRWRGIDAMVNHEFEYLGDLPDGTYSLFTRPQDASGDAGFSAKELHMLGKCVTASVTLGGHYIPEGWNALLDKIAAMQAKEAK